MEKNKQVPMATGIRENDVLELQSFLHYALQDLRNEQLDIYRGESVRKMINILYGRKVNPNKHNRKKQ